jgi:hypothetical protein
LLLSIDMLLGFAHRMALSRLAEAALEFVLSVER